MGACLYITPLHEMIPEWYLAVSCLIATKGDKNRDLFDRFSSCPHDNEYVRASCMKHRYSISSITFYMRVGSEETYW